MWRFFSTSADVPQLSHFLKSLIGLYPSASTWAKNGPTPEVGPHLGATTIRQLVIAIVAGPSLQPAIPQLTARDEHLVADAFVLEAREIPERAFEKIALLYWAKIEVELTEFADGAHGAQVAEVVHDRSLQDAHAPGQRPKRPGAKGPGL